MFFQDYKTIILKPIITETITIINSIRNDVTSNELKVGFILKY